MRNPFSGGRKVKVDERGIYVFPADDDYTDVLGTSVQFPHCDTLILHSPGACAYCDRHPDWQQLRSAQGIAFSDDSDEKIAKHNLIPCPSTFRRTRDLRDRWGGNVPAPRRD